MDDFQMMVAAGRILAGLKWTDAEIELQKKAARDLPSRGLSPAATLLQVAEYVREHPEAKAHLLKAAAKPVAVRKQELAVLERVIPLLRASAAHWPSEEKGEELRDDLRTILSDLWPESSVIRHEEAILAAFSASPQTGWSINAERAVEVMNAPEPEFPAQQGEAMRSIDREAGEP